MSRAQKHALLAAPIENREIGLRRQAELRRRTVAAAVDEAMDDAVDKRSQQERKREPNHHLFRNLQRVRWRYEDNRCRNEHAEQHA